MATFQKSLKIQTFYQTRKKKTATLYHKNPYIKKKFVIWWCLVKIKGKGNHVSLKRESFLKREIQITI